MKEKLKKFIFRLRHPPKDFKLKRFSFKTILKSFLWLGLSGFAAVVLWILFFIVPSLPNVNDIENLVSAESSVIMDREGNVLYTLYGDENRDNVPLEGISQYAIDAIIAVEDDQFFVHIGIDIPAIFKSIAAELGFGSSRGGSTLTQQFVRNAVEEVGRERSYTRKLKEIILALQLESTYSKEEILAFYLNRVGYGGNIYGIETASRAFFAKPASELTIAEGAILASIPNRPTYYSPYGNNQHTTIELSEESILEADIRSEKELADYDSKSLIQGLLGKKYTFGEGEASREIYVKGRTDLVLNRMLFLDYINQEEFDAAVEEMASIEFKPFKEDIKAPHFVFYVREQLEKQYGKEQIEKGGYKITTTLNPALQETAEKVIADQAKTNLNQYDANNAALVSINPQTGEILAMVGSVDYFNTEIQGNVNVTTSGNRSPGSSFKPIAYAAAFLHGGLAPSTVLYDVKTYFSATYAPNNYDGSFNGPVSIRNALGRSLNIPAVKAAYIAGVPNVIDVARKMGIEFKRPDEDYGIALALGATETSPLQMVSAYSVFATGGYKVVPVSILKVEDRFGNLLAEHTPPEKELVLDPEVAFLMNDVLSDVNARPAGSWRNSLTLPGKINAAKTGTSNEEDKATGRIYPKDIWAIGYTPLNATAVWAGNTDGKRMNNSATGLGGATPIWKAFMIEATKDQESVEFPIPPEIRILAVSKRSGKLASKYTPKGDIISAYFPSFSAPSEYDNSYRVVNIDKISGLLATEYTPAETIEQKTYYIHNAYLPDNDAWQKAVRSWAAANGQDEQPPTESDNVHTAETMQYSPTITITSPGSNATVSPPMVGVWVNVDTSQSGKPVKEVRYYLNGNPVSTLTTSPYKGNIPIPITQEIGSTHTITAEVVDTIYRSSRSTIQVTVGKDEVPPSVSLLNPKPEATFSPNTLVSIEASAKDATGDVLKVDFYMDGKLIESVRNAPFVSQVTLPQKEGQYEIKAVAVDHARNQNSDSVMISVETQENDIEGNSRLLSPGSGAVFSVGEAVSVTGFLSQKDRQGLSSVELFYESDSHNFPIKAASIPSTGEGSQYQFVWKPTQTGTYELFMKIVGTNTGFTNRVTVTVE